MKDKQLEQVKKVFNTVVECPFYVGEHGGLTCELAKFRFPDMRTKVDLKYTYCCDKENHKNCTVYQTLMRYYDRKEEGRKRGIEKAIKQHQSEKRNK